MSSMVDMSSEQLVALEKTLKSRYDTLKSQNLALDMTRGKPTPEQLDLSDGLLTLPGAGQFTSPMVPIAEITGVWMGCLG